MDSSKFAHLPGIAYDQPDVYETPDVIDNETSVYYEEEPENDSIERLHISTKNSFNKFKGKYLTGSVDFSDRISRRIRTGYDTKNREWELAGEGETENILQKYNRIQCEIDELLHEIEEVRENKYSSREEIQSYESIAIIISKAKAVLYSLNLEQVLGQENLAKTTEQHFKHLLENVKEFNITEARPETNDLMASNDLAEKRRIAELENRLHKLEKAIGDNSTQLNRLSAIRGDNNLLSVVQKLSAKAALLQPGQLDVIETRLGNLITKMDAISTKCDISNTALDEGREDKLLQLYDIAKRTEPILQILPDMLNRMQALESLHRYANNFSKLVVELETTQDNLILGNGTNKALLLGVQQAFSVNLENINQEVSKLEDRVNQIQGISH